MTLEEKLRALAKKGELVHLSVVFSGGKYRAVFAAASPGSGHGAGEDIDPVKAIEAALVATPVRMPRAASKKSEVTAAVTDDEKAGELPTDWTKP